MKLRSWPMIGHPLSKLISLLAILSISACASVPAAPTQGTLPSSAPVVASTASAVPIVQPAAVQTASPAVSATVAQSSTAPAPTEATVPSCSAPASLTNAVTEGPYFKANSPERASLLEAGVTGTQLTLTGYVLTADCKPVPNALLDFWQANAQGQYDNTGYTLRGHQYTDANGRYQLVTVDPGLYPGRTEHIHVKVQAPNGPILTSQLFFPGIAGNQSDSIFDPSLLVNVTSSGTSMQATFNFIINVK